MEKGKAKSAKGKAQRGPVMTGEALRAWREQRHLSRQALAEMLDIGTATLARYEIGGRMDRDRPGVTVEIPKTVRLAIAALSRGILDYDGTWVRPASSRWRRGRAAMNDDGRMAADKRSHTASGPLLGRRMTRTPRPQATLGDAHAFLFELADLEAAGKKATFANLGAGEVLEKARQIARKAGWCVYPKGGAGWVLTETGRAELARLRAERAAKQ